MVMTSDQLLKRHRNGAPLCLALNNQTVINLEHAIRQLVKPAQNSLKHIMQEKEKKVLVVYERWNWWHKDLSWCKENSWIRVFLRCVGGRSINKNWVYQLRRWQFKFCQSGNFERYELTFQELGWSFATTRAKPHQDLANKREGRIQSQYSPL